MTWNSRFGGRRIYEEKKLPCWSCGTWFVWKVEEQKKSDETGAGVEKQCPGCRPGRSDAAPPEFRRGEEAPGA